MKDNPGAPPRPWLADVLVIGEVPERVLVGLSARVVASCRGGMMDTHPASTPLPADLLPVRDAARLVDRGVSTLRGWVREGALVGYREDPSHPENSRLLVSRAAVLALVVEAGKASAPGRRPPVAEVPDPSPAADLDRQRGALAELRADLRAALAERDGARAVLDATGRTVEVLEARCRDLAGLAEAERRRADDLADRLAAAEAELDALRELQGLPWWRRLLAPPSTAPKRLPGAGDA
jgi:hypothetical protein